MALPEAAPRQGGARALRVRKFARQDRAARAVCCERILLSVPVIFGAGHNVTLVEMRMHVDERRPDVVRFEIMAGKSADAAAHAGSIAAILSLSTRRSISVAPSRSTAIFGPPDKTQIGTRACLIQ